MTYQASRRSVSSTCYCCCWARHFRWVMDMRRVPLQLAAAAAATAVTAPCGRTVVAGVAALPCDIVVVVAVHVVAVHIVSSVKEILVV
jgi:hypothetical protein